MRHNFVRLSVALSICLFVLAGLAVKGFAEDWPKVEPSMVGDIDFVNGGFGIEEREVMPDNYPLKIVFATVKGHYLSEVDVNIYDGAGKKVFQYKADNGPWLLVNLPAGKYRLEAVHNGYRKTPPLFTVPDKGTKTVLVSWKISEVDMGLE